MRKHNFNCSCGFVCQNFSRNLIELTYNYWLSKYTIENDENGYLDCFDELNLACMKHGLVCFVYGYGYQPILAIPTYVKYNANMQPVYADVSVTFVDTLGSKTIKVVDWKILDEKYTSTEMKDELFKQLAIKSEDIFATTFFKNNIDERPLLSALNKIIMDVHKLDEIADINRQLENVVAEITTDKILTHQEANNIGVSVSNNGLNIITYKPKDEEGNLLKIETSLKNDKVTRWDSIEKQFSFYLNTYFQFAGIPKEKLSNQRENEMETYTRAVQVSAQEKEHYKYRQRFINDVNKYYKSQDETFSDIKLDFESAIISERIRKEQNDGEQLSTTEAFNTEGI